MALHFSVKHLFVICGSLFLLYGLIDSIPEECKFQVGFPFIYWMLTQGIRIVIPATHVRNTFLIL